MRALAVTSAKRTRAMPEVPTLLEAMPNGFDLDAWLALAAPAGTPPEIVERLYATLAEALKDPAFRDALGNDGSEIVINSPKDFATLLRHRRGAIKRGVSALIKRVGVKLGASVNQRAPLPMWAMASISTRISGAASAPTSTSVETGKLPVKNSRRAAQTLVLFLMLVT